MLKRSILAAFLLTSVPFFAEAREGMWQPSKIKRQENEMKSLGLKIPVEELYNNEGTGLNNAVVIFGGGCTGEFVSPKGLIFTNHHCAYGTVQSLSSKEKNYLENGFYASSQYAELPCPGLKVTVIQRIEDVTKLVTKNINETMTEEQVNKSIAERIKEVESGYKRYYGNDAEVKPYYGGNEYWVNIKVVYSDVRLVAMPPNGIGKFGADTDNWMWPRMTGDFAVFRVYADKNNQPAEYSPTNVPYKPQRHFNINVGGVKKDDFTMVYGFPYTTQQYLTSYQVEQVQNIIDPIRIEARTRKLNIWNEAMRQDKSVFLKYASKQASIANGWKKWQGEVLGLKENNVIGKKQEMERTFSQYAYSKGTEEDKMLLTNIQINVLRSNNAVRATEYIREAVLGVEAIQYSALLDRALHYYRGGLENKSLQDSLAKIKSSLRRFYKNYDAGIDKKVFAALIPLYMEQGEMVVAPKMYHLKEMSGNNYNAWANNVFSNCLIVDSTALFKILDNANPKDTVMIQKDPAYEIYSAVNTWQKEKLTPIMKRYVEQNNLLSKRYIKMQMDYKLGKKEFYPDANQTLRITYGKVSPIQLSESNIFQTTLDDLIPRHDATVEEFNIPESLRRLHISKDYGVWSENGTVPINFIATNHTSGGNSGSPVLNAYGELIGINFDRIWQGTMSDIYFDDGYCRNIAVDIRYVLFILEKHGNAGWLFDEMTLIK